MRPESRLKNVNSSLLLSVSGGGSTADGAKVIQWSANNGPEQSWTLETATTIAPGEDTTTTATGTSTALAAPTGATGDPSAVGITTGRSVTRSISSATA